MNIKSVYSVAVVSSLLIWNINIASAAPTGGQLIAGMASIAQKGSETTIHQTSSSAIINWKSFDTASNESVRFNQPDVNSVILNRITSGLPTNFAGSLSANGKVFVVNPAGMVFVGGSHVDTSGFVATTMDIDDKDFTNKNYKFFSQPGSESVSIINNGKITANNSGFVALVAPNVVNSQTGIIQADYGNVALASGSTFVLDFNQDSLINFDASSVVKTGHVENAGTVSAYKGKVFMTANDIAKVLDDTVSTSGVVEARDVTVSNDGVINITGKVNAGRVKLCAAKGINIDAPITTTDSAKNSFIAHTQNGNIVINNIITTPTDGSVSLTASNGSITEAASGGINTQNLNTTASTGIMLNSDANAFHVVTAKNTDSGDIYLQSTGGLNINGITQTGGDLTISQKGKINQDDLPSHAMSVSGKTNFISENINLYSDNNFGGPVNISTPGIFWMDNSSHNLVLGNVSVGDLVIRNRAGAISQSFDGAIVVSNNATITTTEAPITLNNSANQFNRYITLENSIYTNQAISLYNSVDTFIGHAKAGGVLTIVSNGGLSVYDSLNSYATAAPNGHSIILSASTADIYLDRLNPGNHNSYLIYVPNTASTYSYAGLNRIYNTPYTVNSAMNIPEGNYLIFADGKPA